MGHWSESLVDELADQLGSSIDRQAIADVVGIAGRELEALSGRSFNGVHTSSSTIHPNGLPFVDVPDVHVGSLHSAKGVWEIADSVHPTLASVLQLQPLEPVRGAVPVADALWIAGQLVTQASQADRLSGAYVLRWIGQVVPRDKRGDLFRQVMDPEVRFYVPVVACRVEGWWFQITRRLVWFTDETRDEGRLLEPLLGDPTVDRGVPPLAAGEAVLTMARLTHQPVDWAVAARIWAGDAQRWKGRRWTSIAHAVHTHGIPTIVIDSASSPAEVGCQILLKAYWHGYISGDEPTLLKAIEAAYTRPVEQIRRGTNSLSSSAAAALLLEELIFPGFDPAQGAEATRRYVRRKTSILVKEHRKREAPEQYPWTRVGVTERHFYKLLPMFASKVNGRYAYDHDVVVAQMREHLEKVERDREVRAAALSLLRSRGFSVEAARKWLQRHDPVSALDATPRQPSSDRARQAGAKG